MLYLVIMQILSYMRPFLSYAGHSSGKEKDWVYKKEFMTKTPSKVTFSNT